MSDKTPEKRSKRNKRGWNCESDNPKNNQIIIGMDAIRNQLEGPWNQNVGWDSRFSHWIIIGTDAIERLSVRRILWCSRKETETASDTRMETREEGTWSASTLDAECFLRFEHQDLIQMNAIGCLLVARILEWLNKKLRERSNVGMQAVGRGLIVPQTMCGIGLPEKK